MDRPDDICRNFHRGNTESEAANPVASTKEIQCEHIIAFMLRTGDATCDETEDRLGLIHQSASARFSELKRDGRILATGERRLTRSGRYAAVYRVAPAVDERGQMSLLAEAR